MKTITNKLLFSTLELISLGAKENTLRISASRQRKSGSELYSHIKPGKELYFYYDTLPLFIKELIIAALKKGENVICKELLKHYNDLPSELLEVTIIEIRKEERRTIKEKLSSQDILKIVSKTKISRKKICDFLDGNSEDIKAGKAIFSFLKIKLNEKAYLEKEAALFAKQFKEANPLLNVI